MGWSSLRRGRSSITEQAHRCRIARHRDNNIPARETTKIPIKTALILFHGESVGKAGTDLSSSDSALGGIVGETGNDSAGALTYGGGLMEAVTDVVVGRALITGGAAEAASSRAVCPGSLPFCPSS